MYPEELPRREGELATDGVLLGIVGGCSTPLLVRKPELSQCSGEEGLRWRDDEERDAAAMAATPR